MYRTKKISSLILAGLILSLVPVQPARSNFTTQDMLVMSALAAGAGALILWLATPSDEQILVNAKIAYNNVLHNHQDTIDTINTFLQKEAPITEDKLYAFALANKRYIGSEKLYQVKNALKSLQAQKISIEDRMQKTAGKKGFASRVYLQMQELITNISTLHMKLNSVQQFLAANNNYFELLNCEQELVARYKTELEDFYNSTLQQQLRMSVMARAHYNEHAGCLYKNYLNALFADINALNRKTQALPNASAYSERHEACRNLEKALNSIKTTLLADADCTRAISEYEHIEAARRIAEEQQRQARIAAQQRQDIINAANRQARAQEEANRQARSERERQRERDLQRPIIYVDTVVETTETVEEFYV